MESAEPSSARCEPVYPGMSYETLIPELTREEVLEDLEIEFRGEFSNQFPHIDEPYSLGACSLTLLAPKHDQSRDKTLLQASIDKRLRFRESFAPAVPSAEDLLASVLLFDSYCDALHISPCRAIPFDEQLYIDCIAENEFAQLSSKSRAVIMANASRSDPDWRHSVVRIFAKTQHKVNEGSLFGPWKACQFLALMHDAIILTFGPVKKYQRAILARQGVNPKIFVYAGKSPFDLAAFAREHFKPNTHRRRCWNDFSAVDQSQGIETTLFEKKKMARVSIPETIQDLHLLIKTTLSCQFGPLTSMRFTGEPGTYDDNTDYNIAILNLKYHINVSGGCFSGDDSLLPEIPVDRVTWGHNQRFFNKLVFDTETGLYGTFCGYYVGHHGAVRAPRPLLAKLIMAEDRNELPLKLASYMAEFAVGHSLGDDLWTLLPVSEVMYQAAAFDFFCRRASSELKVAHRIGEVPSDVIGSWGATLTRPIFAVLGPQ